MSSLNPEVDPGFSRGGGPRQPQLPTSPPASFATDTDSDSSVFNLNATPSLTHTMSATPGGASASAPVSLFGLSPKISLRLLIDLNGNR